jgi:hypothetical protein
VTLRSTACALALFFASHALGACDRQDKQNEARLFLERYDAVKRGGEESRPARVDRLRELPIVDDEVRRIRDRCVEVLLAVVRAETSAAEARTRLAALGDASTIGNADRIALEALLARAQAATDTVNRVQYECTDGVSRLRVHYGRQH